MNTSWVDWDSCSLRRLEAKCYASGWEFVLHTFQACATRRCSSMQFFVMNVRILSTHLVRPRLCSCHLDILARGCMFRSMHTSQRRRKGTIKTRQLNASKQHETYNTRT
ncbi:hypothetical protein CY34DRAFT_436257 [Suillus luteus UH-Slu-Lm8-n1]|uniref:Uncharacterized protein n=1 Tax=Suillus luteus UH-Slu-Lm8-n1 TaxID=930992 RepID=A0A0D0B4Z5_9AGAM|nr:hypothetical protein CY34DRAFT_436257 [Suillus luteus UH-Slu-Lm8-n1]